MLYKTYYLPILTCGVETWINRDANKLHALEMKFLWNVQKWTRRDKILKGHYARPEDRNTTRKTCKINAAVLQICVTHG
jgi:hypothetical protein